MTERRELRRDIIKHIASFYSGEIPSRGALAWFGTDYVETSHGGARKAGERTAMNIAYVAPNLGISARMLRSAVKVRRAAEAYDEKHGLSEDEDLLESMVYHFRTLVEYGSAATAEWIVLKVPEEHWLALFTVMDEAKGIRSHRELWESYNVPALYREHQKTNCYFNFATKGFHLLESDEDATLEDVDAG